MLQNNWQVLQNKNVDIKLNVRDAFLTFIRQLKISKDWNAN